MSNSLIINIRFLRFIAKQAITYYPLHRFVLVCIITCLSIACSNSKQPVTPAVLQAESLIWADSDSARRVLEQISYDSLPQSEQMYWQLLHQHTAIRLGYPVSPDSIMSQVVNYFATHGNKKYLGEALYVQGVEYYLLNQYNDAILYLKLAEDCIAALDTAEPYVGMIYYMQGSVMDEGADLYYIAKDCYIKALPYFQPLPDKRRLACCYRDIARTLDYARDSTAIFYYDTALHIAQTSKDTALYMDILMQRVSFGQQFDSVRLYELCKFDIDSLQHTNYASYVAEYLIERNRLSETAVYLALASEDTIKSVGRAERYHYLHSLLDAKMGRTASAYDELQQVYLNQSAQIAEDAKVRTFAIARHYDLEREKEKSLRLTIRQQKLWIVTGSISAILVIIALLSAFIIKMHRDKEKQLHQKQEIMRLTHEAEHARLQQEQALARAKHEEERARLEQENGGSVSAQSWHKPNCRNFTPDSIPQANSSTAYWQTVSNSQSISIKRKSRRTSLLLLCSKRTPTAIHSPTMPIGKPSCTSSIWRMAISFPISMSIIPHSPRAIFSTSSWSHSVSTTTTSLLFLIAPLKLSGTAATPFASVSAMPICCWTNG